MAKKSRRVAPKEFISKTGVTIIGNVYCRRCMENRKPQLFYQHLDTELDRSGLMSVCKDCCNEIFDESYSTQKTMKKSFLLACRILNIVYDERVVDSVVQEIRKAESNDKKPKAPFGIYRTRVTLMISRTSTIDSELEHDLTFREPFHISEDKEEAERLSGNAFWGTSLSLDDIEFLEERFSDFKKTHTTDTAAEVELLKLVCHNLLSIDRDRAAGKTTIAGVKQLRELMKILTISPDMQNDASDGKNLETYGLRIKYIEEHSPAELIDEIGRDKFGDIDSYELYYENFIKRPTINYNAGLADYLIKDESGETEDWEIKD